MAVSIPEIKADIKKIYSEEGIGGALQCLKKLLYPEGRAYNAVLQLEQELRAVNLQKIEGNISETELLQAYARLNSRLLLLVDELQPSDLEAPQSGKKSRQGSLLYQIPTAMEVYKETRCRVRVAYETAILLDNIELTRDTRIRDVRIADVMQVELIDPAEHAAFSVRTFNRTEQFVEKEEYTEWTFLVKPLRSGSFPLMLRVAVLEKVGDKERARDIVFEETVVIVADLEEAPEPPFKHSGYMVGEQDEKPSAPPTFPILKRTTTTALALTALMAVSGIAYATLPPVRMNVDWTLATVRNTREAYRDFATEYKGQPKARQALAKVEELDWQEVQTYQSIAVVERFMEEHPDSHFEKRATELLASLYYEKVSSMEPSKAAVLALENFIVRFPESKQREQAEKKLPQIKEKIGEKGIEERSRSEATPPKPEDNQERQPGKTLKEDAVRIPGKTRPRPAAEIPASNQVPVEAKKEVGKIPVLPPPPAAEEKKQDLKADDKGKDKAVEPPVEPVVREITPKPTPAPSPERDAPLADTDLRPYNLVRVRGGTFTMGCTGEQGSDCDSDEKPAHRVTVSDFYIGKYEVTQKEWREVMGSSPSYFKNCDNCPVEQVSWEDIQQFLTKLNAKTGKRYRLPTEAEWEYAARGGASSRGYKYAGSNSLGEVAWYDGNSGSKTHPVGEKKANELGLYDMSGNVWEWCQDWYGDYPSDAQTNPRGPDRASTRVNRGGSWLNIARYCRTSNRYNAAPSDRFNDLGFRLAL